jgi:hypothetical protein
MANIKAAIAYIKVEGVSATGDALLQLTAVDQVE